MAARKGAVVKATEAELKQLGVDIATSGIAASAIALSRELDSGDAPAAARATCARALREALDRLRELAPPKEEADGIDELANRRARKRRAAS